MEGPARSDDETMPSSSAARFESLYERHYRSIWSFCRRRLKGELVDDAVAETFLAAWRRIDDVPDGEAALLWLYRVAYRTVGRQWRSRSRHNRLDVRLAGVAEAPPVAPDEAAVQDDELRRVLLAADRLNHNDAEVLRLLSWERLSRTEIAEVLELDPNAVSQRIHRARRNLAREYEGLERRPLTPKGARR